ncbi:MAG: hypothetical protein NXY57DRAFT_1033781, partial [Lentinula lateritia]
SHFNAMCSSIVPQLKSLIPDTTIYFSDLLFAGTTVQLSNNHPSCERPSQLVFEDTCRITTYVSTSNRFLSIGIQYEDMAYASALGIATVGGNNGHNSTSRKAFLRNADVVEDYASRS